MSKPPQTHLICFSHLRWNFVYQRPQHLMTRAAQSFNVWFFEEPVFADEAPKLRARRDASGVCVLTPVAPPGLSSEAIDKLQSTFLLKLLSNTQPRRLVSWYYTPMALAFTQGLMPDITVYDCMDELSGFAGAPAELLDFETDLFAQSDVVFVGGRTLFDSKRERHHNVHLFPSSVEIAHFAQARRRPAEPVDIKGVARPRLGYFGVIDERIDLDLIAQVAAMRPQWSIVMIGPTAKIDPASLPRADNIHWLGMKSYDELPGYLGNIDIGFMPFARNSATRFISPTKTPEFLAAGLPVISTPIADVVDPYGESGLVEIANTAESVIARAEALLVRQRGPWLARVDRFLSRMSWDDTWRGMMQRLAIGDASSRVSKTESASERVSAHG